MIEPLLYSFQDAPTFFLQFVSARTPPLVRARRQQGFCARTKNLVFSFDSDMCLGMCFKLYTRNSYVFYIFVRVGEK